MKIKKINDVYEIEADINKKIVNKHKPLITYTKFTAPASINLNDFIEIDIQQAESVEYKPQINNKPILDNLPLNDAKLSLINYSKIQLEQFLLNNPLLYKDKYYAVTTSAQGYLDSLISATEDAIQLNINFTPYWNDVNGIRAPWTLEELKKLRINIQNYILPFIIQQQKMEKQITQIDAIKDLYNISLTYQK